jgi:hypothetical protein
VGVAEAILNQPDGLDLLDKPPVVRGAAVEQGEVPHYREAAAVIGCGRNARPLRSWIVARSIYCHSGQTGRVSVRPLIRKQPIA